MGESLITAGLQVKHRIRFPGKVGTVVRIAEGLGGKLAYVDFGIGPAYPCPPESLQPIEASRGGSKRRGTSGMKVCRNCFELLVPGLDAEYCKSCDRWWEVIA
jgi:hypothetical protein